MKKFKLLLIVGSICAISVNAQQDSIIGPIGVSSLTETGQGTEKETGNRMAEGIATFMAGCSFVKITERLQLDKVLAEQGLSQTGVVDEAMVIESGKIAGAKLLVTGSITKDGNSYQTNVRLLNTETGDIKGSSSHSGANFQKLSEQISIDLLKSMGIKTEKNQSYKTKQWIAWSTLGLSLITAGLAVYGHIEGDAAESDYNKAINLSASEYDDLVNDAEFNYGMRNISGGVSLTLLGTSLWAFITNEGEWVFSKEGGAK
jgi:hypothetical protein